MFELSCLEVEIGPDAVEIALDGVMIVKGRKKCVGVVDCECAVLGFGW